MGEVFKPEDIIKKDFEVRDISRDIKMPIPGVSLQMIIDEIKALRIEIEKIKRALREHGIKVD